MNSEKWYAEIVTTDGTSRFTEISGPEYLAELASMIAEKHSIEPIAIGKNLVIRANRFLEAHAMKGYPLPAPICINRDVYSEKLINQITNLVEEQKNARENEYQT